MKLSKRKQKEILRLYNAGYDTVEIADAIEISQRSALAVIAKSMVEQEEKEERPANICKYNDQCKICKYRATLPSFGGIHCNYIILKGKSRGCPVDGCTRFEKGAPIREKIKIIVGGRA